MQHEERPVMITPTSLMEAACASLPLLADRDGDGLPDALCAPIVLGARATQPEAIAAMHVAARLAFETLAVRGPVAVIDAAASSSPATALFVGRPQTLAAPGSAALVEALRRLAPGEGLIAADRDTQALVIGGADAAGLEAAALAFCRDWDPAAVPKMEGGPVFAVVRAPVTPSGESLIPSQPGPVRAALSSLATLYGAAGFSWDTDGDLLPDHFATRVAVPDDLTGPEIIAAAQFAARLGLETLGLTLPFAFPASQMSLESRMLTVVIEPLVNQETPPQAEEGSIRLQWQDGSPTLLVAGTSPYARAAALQELAHLDLADSDRPSLAVMERAIARLCALADSGALLCSAAVAMKHPAMPAQTSALLRCPPHLVPNAAALAAAIHGFAFPQQSAGEPLVHLECAAPAPVFELVEQFTWEMDEAWDVLRRQLLPALAALSLDDADWSIDLRISEPEGRRARLKEELLALIRTSGRAVRADQVHVLPAHRQGMGWLLEELVPALLRCAPARVQVRAARFTPAVPSLELPIRWLQDLFPVDELLATRLDLPLDAVSLDLVEQEHTYVLEAFDATGTLLLHRVFDVTFTEIPYLTRFPDWGMVHPPTGCVRLVHRGTWLVDARLTPDPERVWKVVQDRVLPRLEEHIHAVCDGEPQVALQPFFGELSFDCWLSEEDTPIGVREERNSLLESLQEDLYFTVLDFVSALLGARDHYLPPWFAPDQPSRGARLWTAPGRVVPRIHRRDGTAGCLRVQLTPAGGVRDALRYRRGDREDALPLVGAPGVTGAVTGLHLVSRAGGHGWDRDLVFTLQGPVDQQPTAVALLAAWGSLRRAVPHLIDGIPAHHSLTVMWEGGEALRIPSAGSATQQPGLADSSVIASPSLGNRILSTAAIEQELLVLQRSPHVRAYRAGRSAQGRPSYAVELTVPRTEGWWSRTRLSAWKATLLLVARHHANEPSSSNALLELAHQLAKDPQWRRMLDRVNVVIVPGENPDGMALYDQLVTEHPTWMHHAARYNAAGLEYAGAYTNPLTPHSEALVVPDLWQRWLPDIVCDDHGFPAHEWLQLFAGHGNPWFRDYWIAQGLIFAYLNTVRHPRFPAHWEAMEHLRERIIRVLASDAEVALWNRAHADRYRAFLHRWDPDRFPASYDRDVLVHIRAQDPDSLPSGADNSVGLPVRFPAVATASLITEVADESAQGAYLGLCTRAHLLVDQALVEYLYAADAPALIQRVRLWQEDGTLVLTATRPRPLVAPRPAEESL
jgi:hypothetical protein